MDIKNDYIIFQPQTNTIKKTQEKEKEISSPATGDVLQKEMVKWAGFYDDKTSFTPISEGDKGVTKNASNSVTVKQENKEIQDSPKVENKGIQADLNTIKGPQEIDVSSREAKTITDNREGSLLNKDNILKSDQYPGINELKWLKINKRSMGQLEKNNWFEFSGKNMEGLKGKVSDEKLEVLQKQLKNKSLSQEELNKKLKDMNFSKEEIDLVTSGTKSSFTPEKLKIVDSLRNKTFSKEELTNELLKKNFSEGEIKEVVKNAYKPEGGKFKEIEGAPNYRTTKGVTGTGQPTIDGMKKILDEAGAKNKTVKWINMREEPVVYVNGKPYNLRQAAHPDKNLEQGGLSAQDVEKQEEQIKKEILEEAKKNGGYIVIKDEKIDGNGKFVNVDRKVKVTEDSVKTVKEVYDDLAKEGYKVDYKRVPVSDEKPPEKKDFDELVNILKNDDPDMPTILNCHAGRGRTTTAMVIADLIKTSNKEGDTGKTIRQNKTFRDLFREYVKNPEGEGSRLRSVLSLVDAVQTAKTPEDVDKVINAIEGKDSPAGSSELKANEAIDREGQVQNLREATIKQLKKFKTDPAGKDKALDFLKRYFDLIAFQDYIKDEGKNGYKVPFSQWIENNKDINDMFSRVQLALNNPAGMDATAMA
jgi:protein-tyrosine phosphatase